MGWQGYLRRAVDIFGEEKAADIAKRQGVPFTVGAAPLSQAAVTPAESGGNDAMRRRMFALGLYIMRDAREAAGYAGLEIASKEEIEELAAEVRKRHKDYAEGAPGLLGQWAFATMLMSIMQLSQQLPLLTPGAKSQLVGALFKVWNEVSGGGFANDIMVTMGQRPENWDADKEAEHLQKDLQRLLGASAAKR